MKKLILIFSIITTTASSAQYPLHDHREAVEIRYAMSQPVINYTLRVDENDLNSVFVEMHIRNIPDTFHVAMVTHPEYDDRFWRYVKNFRAKGKNGLGTITSIEDALWKVIAPGGEVFLEL